MSAMVLICDACTQPITGKFRRTETGVVHDTPAECLQSKAAAQNDPEQVAITVQMAFFYPRAAAPADFDLIVSICQFLHEADMRPLDVKVLSHEYSGNGNQPAGGAE